MSKSVYILFEEKFHEQLEEEMSKAFSKDLFELTARVLLKDPNQEINEEGKQKKTSMAKALMTLRKKLNAA